MNWLMNQFILVKIPILEWEGTMESIFYEHRVYKSVDDIDMSLFRQLTFLQEEDLT